MAEETEEDIFDKEISDDECTDEDEYEVEKIVSDSWDAEKQIRYYEVKWVGYPSSQNTLEPEENLKCSKLLKEYKDEKSQKIRKSCERDSGDEDFIVSDDESLSVNLSKSNIKQHRHMKTISKSEKKGNKYKDHTTSKNKLTELLKGMKSNNKSSRSSYPVTSKIKHRKKHQNENDSSSISSSNNSSRDTSLRPNSESGSSVSSFNPEKNKRKRLKTVDEEDSDVALKRSLETSSDSDIVNNHEQTKKPQSKYSKELNENKTTSVPNSSTSTTSFEELFQKYRKKRKVDEANKLKKQKSKEERKLEVEKRLINSKEEALREYLTSQSETENELDSCSNSNCKLDKKDEAPQKLNTLSGGSNSSSLSDKAKCEENFNVIPTEVVSDNNGKEKTLEKMSDNIAISPEHISEHDGINELKTKNDIILESNNEKDDTEHEHIGRYLIDSDNEQKLMEELKQIDRHFECKIDHTPTAEEQMSKLRPSINDSDEDIYSEGEIRDTEQMDLDGNQTPKCPRVVESDDDEHNSVTNVNITSANVDNDNQNGQNMTPSTNEVIQQITLPTTVRSDFYKGLCDGSVDDWENNPELTEQTFEDIPMEELDPPDYEPIKLNPISVDGLTIAKVRIFNSSDQKNGFDRGWKVHFIRSRAFLEWMLILTTCVLSSLLDSALHRSFLVNWSGTMLYSFNH
ncbi:Chromo domain-containing protein [Meloidogyne graminicola]|uniref:Chromo domain-containing protein n=1 Tax=Meloidogyne graminicola TaxID=189291 RepID=A0A8S9ZPE2_9BILA|nr:Chromo domain-containing protein [Meloidogyne graminicola]